jgi:hypothetical protein
LKWDPDDKERTALHEAGHAVVAWSFNLTVGCIHLDLNSQGGSAHIYSAADLEASEQIARWLAGFEAEQAFKPPGRRYNAEIDAGEVRRILRENGTSIDEPEGKALRRRGRARAKRRLLKHGRKVRAVADHLVEHHYIDRVTFEALMKDPNL